MLKLILILLVLTFTQAGCSIEEGGGHYEVIPMTQDGIGYHEPNKREFLKIEDLTIGSGPLAAWGRKISAEIEVRYTDGTIVYRGPMFLYLGFSPFIHDALKENGVLNLGQYGIWLGINGMAVGGKRRITIEPKLVESGLLVKTGYLGKERVGVRREKLIVEATLTASCVPVLLRALHVNVGYVLEREIWCRDANGPQRTPTDPIWRFY